MLVRSPEVRPGSLGREFMCFWYWVLPYSKPTLNYHHPLTLPSQSLQPVHSLPIGPGISPKLTSLTLNQKTLRLPIITFPAETVDGW